MYFFFSYYPENYSRRVCKSTNKKFWPQYKFANNEVLKTKIPTLTQKFSSWPWDDLRGADGTVQ